MLQNLPITQKSIAYKEKETFQSLNLPVKTPMPMYKNTIISDTVARVEKIWKCGNTLFGENVHVFEHDGLFQQRVMTK
jgi:hypothetical protein